MRNVLLRLGAFLLPLVFSACGDLPTVGPLSDASGAGHLQSDECIRDTGGTIRCGPFTNDPVYPSQPEDPCMTSMGPRI
jgi:hypothetical protein